jgi:hypothetical protein
MNTAMESPPPPVWGPSLWRAIHLVALGFPADAEATPEQRQAYRAFFENLHYVIPCNTCAVNYQTHLKHDMPRIPLDRVPGVETQPRLFAWTVELHNVVNRSLGKPDDKWTPQRAYDGLVSRRDQKQQKKQDVKQEAKLQKQDGQHGQHGRSRAMKCLLCALIACLAAAAVVALICVARRCGGTRGAARR